MTFFQARTTSKTGYHVRRESWPIDKWFIVWRGLWFCFAASGETEVLRVVEAGDYAEDDLRATDWTTVPGALDSCPITPTAPGGGGPPSTPDGPPPTIPTGPYIPPIIVFGPSPSGGGGGSGPYIPPPPPPATPGLSVTFSGLTYSNPSSGSKILADCELDGAYPLTHAGGGTWIGGFTRGTFSPDGYMIPMHWRISVSAPTYGDVNARPYAWEVEMSWSNFIFSFSAGGFHTFSSDFAPAGSPIPNSEAAGIGFVGGGTATVHN